LAVCASKDPKSEVRMTTIFGKTLGTLFSTFFNHIGTMGLILMIALMLACFFRPKSYEEEHHVLKYTWKSFNFTITTYTKAYSQWCFNDFYKFV